MRTVDLTGQRFGRLIVLQRAEKGKRGKARWVCECDCGCITKVGHGHLKSGNTKSCGCFRREGGPEKPNFIHGHSKAGRSKTGLPAVSPTYQSWCEMWRRCTDRNRDCADRYVKRGIQVDPRWKSFVNFLADMGERPPGTSLHREKNNFGYSKTNCRWATWNEQARNRSNTKLTFATAVEIALRTIKREGTQREIAHDYVVCQSMVYLISQGKSWPDVRIPALVLFELQKLMPGISLASTVEDLCGLAKQVGGDLEVDIPQFRLHLKIAA
jgi:hypothetical protein